MVGMDVEVMVGSTVAVATVVSVGAIIEVVALGEQEVSAITNRRKAFVVFISLFSVARLKLVLIENLVGYGWFRYGDGARSLAKM